MMRKIQFWGELLSINSYIVYYFTVVNKYYCLEDNICIQTQCQLCFGTDHRLLDNPIQSLEFLSLYLKE